MLVLSRKSGQRILIGDSIELEVIEVRGNRVQIGFTAPVEVAIHRAEVHRRTYGEPAEALHAALASTSAPVPATDSTSPQRQ